MKVKFKKIDLNAVIPSKAHATDAGFDLVGTSKTVSEKYTEIGTGLAVSIPKGFVGLIFPRSSISNYSNLLSNSVGVIDAGYHGEIKFRFKTLGWNKTYEVGDKIGQLVIMPIPEIELVEVQELEDSERGQAGFGSSGA